MTANTDDAELLKAAVCKIEKLERIINTQGGEVSKLFELTEKMKPLGPQLRELIKAQSDEIRKLTREGAHAENTSAKLRDGLRTEIDIRSSSDFRLSALQDLVSNKIAGSEGGVVKAMETAMPDTTWKIEISGGKP